MQGIVVAAAARQPAGMTEPHDNQQLVDNYIALWNERDPDTRRKLLRELWAPDGGQVLVDAPLEVRDAARRLNFPVPSLEVRGYDVLEARVTRAYEMFVEPGEYVFALDGEVTQLVDGVITFTWTMTAVATGESGGRGVDVLRLDKDGRIRSDYQFIEG